MHMHPCINGNAKMCMPTLTKSSTLTWTEKWIKTSKGRLVAHISSALRKHKTSFPLNSTFTSSSLQLCSVLVFFRPETFRVETGVAAVSKMIPAQDVGKPRLEEQTVRRERSRFMPQHRRVCLWRSVHTVSWMLESSESRWNALTLTDFMYLKLDTTWTGLIYILFNIVIFLLHYIYLTIAVSYFADSNFTLWISDNSIKLKAENLISFLLIWFPSFQHSMREN